MGDEGLAGRTLAGRYDVLALLGAGGMGAVYRARDRDLDEEVALKVILDDVARHPAALERFRREVKLARRVTHRNVARTFELGHCDGVAFCTMELVEGESLRDRLHRVHRLPVAEAVAIARELCEGLGAAHAAGVVHRDIKPANVLIARDGRVVLADFGVAALSVAESGEISGTPAYMAPEQARGAPASPASDIYAVGVLLYEMIAGERAFPGATEEILHAKRHTPHLELDGVSRDLASLIARTTAREVSERIASARELALLLGELAHAVPSAPPGEDSTGYELRTLLVLPARADESVAHLALAVQEEVLARLGRLPLVRALPRTSPTAEPADAVVELVAGSALTATITRSAGPPIVLTLPLAVGELDAAADAIASAAATSLQPAPRYAPHVAAARELLLRARSLVQRSFAATGEAIALLERAAELDPGDARIAATLAIGYVRTTFLSATASVDQLSRARQLVDAALAAAPQLAESHIAAGQLELNVGESWRAARYFREAIARAPHVADAHEYLGRMLLEAGFLDVGLARLGDALAIAPALTSGRWDIARMWALEGQWDEHERLVAQLVAEGSERWIALVRAAMWRGDGRALARMQEQVARGTALPKTSTPLIRAMLATVVGDAWQMHGHALVAEAMAPRASRRNAAFTAQLVAETAGHFHDAATCMAMVERAADIGVFDLHWLDRCPLLELVRDLPAFRSVRARVADRAVAILDAMYGDHADSELAETTVR